MSELYWIATQKNYDLEIRYAAARQLQQSRQPEREIKERKTYTNRERELVRSDMPAEEAARLTERTVNAVRNQRKKKIKEQYPSQRK